MANRTASYANSIHGSNPQLLIGKITKTRIHESKYWKEQCTLLTSALVLEKAVDDLKYVGGTFGGNNKPSPFLCLVLKLLQIQPTREIVHLYIKQTDFKYLRALGAFYLRLIGSAVEIYSTLEPLLSDYRKLRLVDKQHNFSVIHMDQLIDDLLREEEVFDVKLPRIPKRYILEDNQDIEPYKSELEEQNLIPTQIINERIEQSAKGDKRQDKDHHSTRNTIESHSRRDSRERHHPKGPTYSKKTSSRSTAGNGRFKQEDIDNENAIRAKLGLRPLR